MLRFMKKFLGILVLVLFTTWASAKTKDIGNGLTISIPKSYKYFELDINKLLTTFPDLKKMQSDEEEELFEQLGIGSKTKLIIITDNPKPIRVIKKLLASKPEAIVKKIEKDLEPYQNKIFEEYVKKFSYEELQDLSEDELNELVMPAIFNLLIDKYKFHQFGMIFIADKKLGEDAKEDLLELTEDFEEEIKIKNKDEILEEITENFDEDSKKIWDKLDIKIIEIGTNYNNEYYVLYEGDYNETYASFKSKLIITTINDKIFFASVGCYKNCNNPSKILSEILAPTNLLKKKTIKFDLKKGIKKTTTKKIESTSSDLVEELKELNKLYEDGALTKEEFEKAKKKILSQ